MRITVSYDTAMIITSADLQGAETRGFRRRGNDTLTQRLYISFIIFQTVRTSLEQEERKPLFYQKGQGIGLFQLNNFLYANCIRRWKVPRRYQVVGVNPDFTAQVEERPEYRHHHRGLMACKALVDKRLTTPGNNQVQDCDFIEELKVVAQKTGIA